FRTPKETWSRRGASDNNPRPSQSAFVGPARKPYVLGQIQDDTEGVPMKPLVHYFACAIALTSYAALAAPGPKQFFSLTIASPNEPIRAGTELRLLVAVTNTSDRTISFLTSPGPIPEDGARYEIDVRDSQ